MADLIDHIEEELAKRGWNRNELAIRSKVDSGYVSRILNRERKAGPDTLLSFADAPDIPPLIMFQWAGWIPEGVTEKRISEQVAAYKLSELSDDQIDNVLAYIEFIQARDDYKLRSEKKGKREGITPPEPLKQDNRT